MGIPQYFRAVTRKFPTIIDHHVPPCSRLFLDLNCAIHQCANNILQMNQSITKETVETEIVNHTIEYINKISSYVKPKDLLFIAIDGIPPRAKIVQQRKRRFVSSWRDNIINQKKRESRIVFTDWDRNAITPGTDFMNYLSQKLHAYFNQKQKFPFKVIFSDSNEVGEGEAKILDHIKATAIPQNNDIIYGLDADLIMLSLLSDQNNIYLLREPTFYDMKVQRPFLLMNIQMLRQSISLECSGNDDSEYDVNGVWDYVVLCFFQGNDFIPPLSFLKIKYNGIEMVVQTYRKIKEDLQQNLVVKDNNNKFNLNYMFLLKLIENLKNTEDENFCEADEKYYTKSIQPYHAGKRTPLDRLAADIDNYPIMNKFPSNKIQPFKTGWRMRYYHYLFDADEISDVNDICQNYLEGIEWVFQYYFVSCISKDWYYRTNYSPSIMDLYNFLIMNPENVDVILKKSIETNYPKIQYDTDLQLLMCLPPSSKDLLKPNLQNIITDVSLGCSHFYPQKFKIATYLKNYLWECSPLLCSIDDEKLSRIKSLVV